MNLLRQVTGHDLRQWLKEDHLVLSAQANLDNIVFWKQQIGRTEAAQMARRFNSRSGEQRCPERAKGGRRLPSCSCFFLPPLTSPSLPNNN
jgi:hypothetical protein